MQGKKSVSLERGEEVDMSHEAIKGPQADTTTIRKVASFFISKRVGVAMFASLNGRVVKYKLGDDVFDLVSEILSQYYFPESVVFRLIGKFTLSSQLSTDDPISHLLDYFIPPEDIIVKVKQVHKLYFGEKSPYFSKEYKELLRRFAITTVKEPGHFVYVIYYDRRSVIVYQVDVYKLTDKDIDEMSRHLLSLRKKYYNYIYNHVRHLLVPQSNVDKVIAFYMISKILTEFKALLLDKMDEFKVPWVSRYELSGVGLVSSPS